MSGYDIDPNNQLVSDGVYNYTYDAEGNRLSKTKISTGEKEEYTWDHRNRLVTIKFKNSGGSVIKQVDQTYDVLNQWIKRRIDPDGATGSAAVVDTYFSHLDGQIVAEFDGSSGSDLSHRYFWNPAAIDQLLADETVTSLSSEGTVLYPLGDHLGTLRDLATYNDSTNVTTISNHRRYDSFGNLISETNASIDEFFAFTGRPFDDSTNLQNNLHRWYDPSMGQWISEDPIEFASRETNLRRTVHNEPTRRRDPSGLDGFSDIFGPTPPSQVLESCYAYHAKHPLYNQSNSTIVKFFD
jgi:RHS repeat-associated protein